MELKDHIAQVPDFPKPGILFYDISTLLAHPPAWREVIHRLTQTIWPYQPDYLAGVESRGFLAGAPAALALNCGLIMIRKSGKLPGATISHTYELEYGSDTLEIQQSALVPGKRVVVIDDLLATGGTLQAAIELIRKADGIVPAAATIVELTFLGGRQRVDVPVEALVAYDS